MSTGSPVHSLLTRPVSARPARPMIFNVEKWMRFIDCTLISANLINKDPAGPTNKQTKEKLFYSMVLLCMLMAVRFLQVVSTIPLYTFLISRGEKSESKAS